VRVAKWAVAKTLRCLNRLDEALSILLPLAKEYDSMTDRGELDIPAEMLPSIRGLVNGEIAEVYAAKTKDFAKLAQRDLSKDEWFKKLEPESLERLQRFADL
jgi:hypothetical protein